LTSQEEFRMSPKYLIMTALVSLGVVVAFEKYRGKAA
jgi:hypothetical protein